MFEAIRKKAPGALLPEFPDFRALTSRSTFYEREDMSGLLPFQKAFHVFSVYRGERNFSEGGPPKKTQYCGKRDEKEVSESLRVGALHLWPWPPRLCIREMLTSESANLRIRWTGRNFKSPNKYGFTLQLWWTQQHIKNCNSLFYQKMDLSTAWKTFRANKGQTTSYFQSTIHRNLSARKHDSAGSSPWLVHVSEVSLSVPWPRAFRSADAISARGDAAEAEGGTKTTTKSSAEE